MTRSTGDTYTVSGPAPVLGHKPGETFKASLEPTQEARLIAAGHLVKGREDRATRRATIATRRYKVSGAAPVLGYMPGDTFTAALDPAMEARMIRRGQIKPVSKRKRPAKPAGTQIPRPAGRGGTRSNGGEEA